MDGPLCGLDQEARGLIALATTMDPAIHHFGELFAQLGLPNDAVGIAHFLTVHASMADGFRLPDAPFWTASQAAFLRESLLLDSDWSGVVDQLSKALQGPHVTTRLHCVVDRSRR